MVFGVKPGAVPGGLRRQLPCAGIKLVFPPGSGINFFQGFSPTQPEVPFYEPTWIWNGWEIGSMTNFKEIIHL